MPASKEEVSILTYVQILHDYGVGSHEAISYKKRYANDPVFTRRAQTADKLFLHKDRVLEIIRSRKTA